MVKIIAATGLLLSIGLLAGCSSSQPQEPTSATGVTYTDLRAYGVDMGCRAALQNVGTPESDWSKAPKLTGTKADYLDGWRQGFQKCRIGLGPVQLPHEQK